MLTTRLAWGFVLALLALGGVGSVLGIVLGVKPATGLRPPGERGSGLALASIVVGAMTLVAAVVYWIAIARHFGGGSSGGGTGGGGY